MKKVRYVVDLELLKVSKEEKAQLEKLGQKQLFENILNQLLSAKHQQGLSGSKGRIYSRLLAKLDKTQDEIIELEEAEFDILTEIFLAEDINFAPSQTRIIMQYVDAVTEAKG